MSKPAKTPRGPGNESDDPDCTTLVGLPQEGQLRRGLLPRDIGVYLQVMEGEDSGRRFDLSQGGIFTIGRRDCNIPLNDRKVSRKHAEIQVLARDQYFVIDLASRNGTFVNGVRLNRRKLKHNDIIRIGDSPLQLTVIESAIDPNGEGVSKN